MNEEQICQSCAIPLTQDILGTNVDGSLSNYYCKYCFQNGNFTEDLTLNDAINIIANNADEVGITREEAIDFATRNLPNLKRWKQ